MSDLFMAQPGIYYPIHEPRSGSRKIINAGSGPVYFHTRPDFQHGDEGVTEIAAGESAAITERVWLINAGYPDKRIIVEGE